MLGLDEGRFPRDAAIAGIDLMARCRRSGDRDVRSDDRWLFLETVMAAGDRLHLSYLGEGVADGKPRNPAAPLAELMAALDGAAGVVADGPGLHDAQAVRRARPWWVRHPLQPFDERYFDGADPALFSHRAAFARADVARQGEPVRFAPLHWPVEAADAGIDPLPLTVAEVLGYWRDPAKALLQDTLKLRIAVPQREAEDEPLELAPSAIDRLPRRLLREALASGAGLPDAPPRAIADAGLLPPGAAAQRSWRMLRDSLAPVLERWAGDPLFASGWPAPLALPATPWRAGAWTLTGPLPDAAQGPQGPVLLVEAPGKASGALGWQLRIGLFLQWALLRLHPQFAGAPVTVAWLTQDGAPAWGLADLDAYWLAADAATGDALRAQLEQRVVRLLQWTVQARTAPLPYFPKLSEALASDKAKVEWTGGYNRTGERDYAPGHARMLADGIDYDAVGQQAAAKAFAKTLLATLDVAELLPKEGRA